MLLEICDGGFSYLTEFATGKPSREHVNHGLINYIETKAQCRLQKKLTWKGTLWQVFLSEFLDWIYSESCWYFWPSFVNCCPCNLLSGSSSPLHLYPLWISILYTVYSVCVWGGGGVLGLRQKNTCHKIPFIQANFFKMTFCIAFYESHLSTV